MMITTDVRHCNECITVIAALPLVLPAVKHTINVIKGSVKGPRK